MDDANASVKSTVNESAGPTGQSPHMSARLKKKKEKGGWSRAQSRSGRLASADLTQLVMVDWLRSAQQIGLGSAS